MPRRPLINKPEFKAAVDAAVEERLANFQAELLAKLGDARRDAPAPMAAARTEAERVATTSPSDSDRQFARGLATAIAELGDQGVGRGKRVSPEVMAAREEARQRMISLIIEARAKGDVPAYRLKHKVYLDERIVEPVWIAPDHTQRHTEIDWPGVPNHAMIPINDVAHAIHVAFMESVGSNVATPMDDLRDLSVTAGGLVIKGGPRSAPRMIGDAAEAQHVGQGTSGGEGLRVRGRQRAGTVVETRVLGTVAEPARQNA